ncbi:MAG: hypothetical protein IPL61_05490 [Myxococcales bacterium]|nr:hypothetical protein [Myxococcales bacterium]
MPMIALAALLAAVVLALALTVGARRLAARGRSRRARRVGRAAADGELAGAALLEAAGFAVIDRQVRHALTVEVDAERYDAGLRCDYLVERAGQRWVGEIKTGAEAPSLANPATRRQLLEYQVAYGAVGVVLVDATTGAVHEVRFALPVAAVASARWPLFVLGVAVGVALTIGLR